MADSDKQPVIVRRKKNGHGDHHSGAWKVAFADFMTAMMAFFLVMWLTGQKDEVKQAVAGYFRDPGSYATQGGAGILQGGTSALDMQPRSEALRKDDNLKSGDGPDEKETKEFTLAAKKITAALEQQEAFQRLQKNVKLQLTSEGLRIILNESEDSPAFFEPGSAKLLQKSAIILITIARELGKLDNKIVIEGHTDASYAGTKGYSNWELSADRANAARALMEVSGLAKGQVREVRGFADKFPMIKNRPNDPRNRRVSLLVLYKSREYAYDQVEVGRDLMSEI